MGGGSSGCRLSVAATLLLTAAAGCDSQPSEPRTNGNLAIALLTESLEADAAGLTTGRVEHPCPAGGRIISDGETRLIEEGEPTVYEWDRTVEYDRCTFNLGGTTAWTDGALEFAGISRFGPPVNGRSPLLSQESTQKGTLTTTRNGQPQQCDYDIAIRYDAASGEYVVTGTACNQPINFRRAIPDFS